MPCASFSMFDGPGGTGSWRRKASAKKVSLTSFLHSEVNKLIQHIIVQDQDGQTTTLISLWFM